MALRISFAPYRLLFKHPFATSHGVRDGTDSIFIKVEEHGVADYGEVTLPPYLAEKPEAVIQRVRAVAERAPGSMAELLRLLEDRQLFGPGAMGCRNGLNQACMDALGISNNKTVAQLLHVADIKIPVTLVTLGITPVKELQAKLKELPASGGLKLKVGHPESEAMVLAVKQMDARPLFIDANQGLGSVVQAMQLVEAAGSRFLGVEQPFILNNNLIQSELQNGINVCVYGDEAIQDLVELEHSISMFNGVNIKLIKCGGLDRAKAMADRAEELGMKVMLGSMSESSLGCTAMAHLAGQADLLDLDGPWLIKNDPFEGMAMRNGKLVMPEKPGIGAVLKAELDFIPICA